LSRNFVRFLSDTDTERLLSREDVIPYKVMHETGDLLAAHRVGVDFESKVASLADLVQGRIAGRDGAGQILLYKSVGSSLQDIAVAELCVEKAEQEDVGTMLPFSLSLKHGRK